MVPAHRGGATTSRPRRGDEDGVARLDGRGFGCRTAARGRGLRPPCPAPASCGKAGVPGRAHPPQQSESSPGSRPLPRCPCGVRRVLRALTSGPGCPRRGHSEETACAPGFSAALPPPGASRVFLGTRPRTCERIGDEPRAPPAAAVRWVPCGGQSGALGTRFCSENPVLSRDAAAPRRVRFCTWNQTPSLGHLRGRGPGAMPRREGTPELPGGRGERGGLGVTH